MLQFTKTPDFDLNKVFLNPQNQSITTPIENGSVVTIYTKDIISQGEGVTIEWLIPFELWEGQIEDRKTAPKVVLNEDPFTNEMFRFRLFNDLGEPMYPFVKSELPYILGMIEDANLICAKYIEAVIPELSGLVSVVGI